MHLISQDLLLKPTVWLPPVMSPSLWILTLLLFIHLPAAPLVGASAPFPPPRRLLSNETAAAGLTTAAPTTPPPPDLCSTSTSCHSRIFPHSRTLTIAVVAIFVACVIMAFVSVYARRFCIHEGNLGTNYYSMEMCGGYAGNDALVKSLPVVKYEAGEDESKKTKECAVCLSEFERGEMLRLLPACEHLFHKDCIDMWLFSHTTCPLCRVSLLKHRRGSQSSGAPHQISEAVDLQPILSSHHAPLVTTAAG